MTTHDRQLIDIADLGVIRMECKCGAALVVGVETQKEVPTQCSACGVQWLAYNTPQHQAVQSFWVRLKDVRAYGDSLPFQLRFETIPAGTSSR